MKRQWTPDTQSKDDSLKHYVEQKEPRHSRTLTAWFYLHETLEKVSLWRQEAEQWLSGVRGRKTGMRHRGTFKVMEIFYILTRITQFIHFWVNLSTLYWNVYVKWVYLLYKNYVSVKLTFWKDTLLSLTELTVWRKKTQLLINLCK